MGGPGSGRFSERYISLSEMARLLGISDTTARRWWRKGDFPPAVPNFGVRPRWLRESFMKWVEEKKLPLSE